MIKHTPGPWTCTKHDEITTQIPDEQVRYPGNGTLIAVAPELFEACQMLINSWKPEAQAFDTFVVREAYEMAKVAIGKMSGEVA